MLEVRCYAGHIAYRVTSPAAYSRRSGREFACGHDVGERQKCGAHVEPTCSKSRRGEPADDPRPAAAV